MNDADAGGLTSAGVRREDAPSPKKTATGFDSPTPEAHKRPSSDARRFFIARLGRAGAAVRSLWRAVRGVLRGCRSSGRSVNRVPPVALFDSGAAVTHIPEDRHMAATAAAFPAVSQSPVIDLRTALDRLGHVSGALNAVRDLLIPEDGLASVDRDSLAGLFGLIRDAASNVGADETDWQGMSAGANRAVCDLLAPCEGANGLEGVSRDHLCALVDLLAHMHAAAVADAWQSMQRVGQ
jgi:hypothetical protein